MSVIDLLHLIYIEVTVFGMIWEPLVNVVKPELFSETKNRYLNV